MQVDEDTMEWHVWTCQRRMMTKFNNAGWEAFNIYEDEGRIISCEYKMPFNAVTIRSKKAVNSPSKSKGRKLSAEHLAKMQKARRG